MDKTKEIKEVEQETSELPEEKKKLFTPGVTTWIICFIIMLSSLIYKESYLDDSSDEWKLLSAVHVITALICIISVSIYNLRNQRAFDSDIEEINKYIEHVPIIQNHNRIYANDRELYERTLDGFIDYIRFAKFLYYFGVIALTVAFFVWDITKYFLSPNAYVVSLSSDIGWDITAAQIYFPGIIISGLCIIGSVMIRDVVIPTAKLFTQTYHTISLMNIMLKKS
jgi:hypothetical protein